MERTSLVRLGGVAGMVGGLVYASLGLVVWYIQPSSNTRGLQLLFSIFFITLVLGILATIVSLHTLHRRKFYGMAQRLGSLLVSLAAFVGLALILAGELGDAFQLLQRDTDALWYYTPLYWGRGLAVIGIMALAVVTIEARVLPWWCGVALIIGSLSLALVGMYWEAWLGALVGADFALVGYAVFRAAMRQSDRPPRVHSEIRRQDTMRAPGVRRFGILAAVGFGIVWTLLGAFGGGFAMAGGVGLPMFGAFFSGDFLALVRYVLVFSAGGAFGGAVLGLGLWGGRKAAGMTVLGAVGFFLGSFIVTGLYFLFSFYSGAGYSFLEVVSAAALGLVLGVVLSLALLSWRSTAGLGLAGLIGFGIGGLIAAALQGFPLQPLEGGPPSWQFAVSGAIEGLIGGAWLGAAFGRLRYRRLAARRRPRVR